MSLPKPDLDNKTFDQLVEEARKLIPRYSPEWTDHNLSDPGITFIELFAWLTEIALYRTNLVMDKHRLRYLKLLGVKPHPQRPAKVDLTFSSDIGKTLNKGTQVSTEIAGKTVYFQLEEDISIVPGKPEESILEKIVVDEYTSGIYDRSSSNENGDLFFAPFGEDIQKGCALYLGFNFSNKAPDTLSLMCYLYEKDLIEPGRHGAEEDCEFKNASLKWELWALKSQKKDWYPIDLVNLVDKTEDFKKNGRIVFKGLNDYEWVRSSLFPVKSIPSKSYFWLRCRAEESHYEYLPRIENLRLNTVSAIHKKIVSDDDKERLGNGLPGQIFKLREIPILDNTLKLLIKQDDGWRRVDNFYKSCPSDKHFVLDSEKRAIKLGNGKNGLIPPADTTVMILTYASEEVDKGKLKGYQEWISNGLPNQIFELKETQIKDLSFKLEDKWVEVDDFEGSGPSDKHFVLDNETGELRFGDGLMGLAPPQGSSIEILEYVTGGGEEGNVKACCEWKAERFSGNITNYRASTGGKKAQTIEEAIDDFRRDLKVPYTAVTLKDFEYIARNTPGLRVARAKAIPDYNPFFNLQAKNPDDNRGAVTVVVIPYTPLEILKHPPEPSEGFMHEVCRHLDKHRLLGTEIHVIPPVYIKVSISATVVQIESFHDDSLIVERVIGKLNHFLHPIKGGSEGNGWPIGGNVYLSELYDLIEKVEGVNCVLRLSISGDQNASTDAYGNLILNFKHASIYSGSHSVKIVRETDRCRKRGDGYSGS